MPHPSSRPTHSKPTQLVLPRVVAAIRAASKAPLPAHIEPHHSFVLDLGFDSMSMAFLGLALEDQFNCVVLLDSWIGQHSEPAALTVASLCDYLQASLASNGPASVHG